MDIEKLKQVIKSNLVSHNLPYDEIDKIADQILADVLSFIREEFPND